MISADRNQGAAMRPGSTERVTKWMAERDRAQAEGRTEDAADFQRIIDTYQPSAASGTPAAHKSTRALRFEPTLEKYVHVEAVRSPDGTLAAEDGGAIVDPASAVVLQRYFEPDPDTGRALDLLYRPGQLWILLVELTLYLGEYPLFFVIQGHSAHHSDRWIRHRKQYTRSVHTDQGS